MPITANYTACNMMETLNLTKYEMSLETVLPLSKTSNHDTYLSVTGALAKHHSFLINFLTV